MNRIIKYAKSARKHFFWISLLAAVFIIFPIIQKSNAKIQNNNFAILLDKPVVVAQGLSYKELKWGPYQFPRIGFTVNGEIYCIFSNKPDSPKHYEGGRLYYISTDYGETWHPANKKVITRDLLMSNGCYFQGVNIKNAYESQKIKNKKESFLSDNGKIRVFLADEKETIYDNSFYCKEYDPKTKVLREFKSIIHWPFMPLVERNGVVLTTSSLAAVAQKFKVGNDLYMALYSYGFDSKTGKIKDETSNIYIFKSQDSARNWYFISQILPERHTLPEDSTGLFEPYILQIPNGEFLIVMRTGNGLPSLCARSIDKCENWTKLIKFEDIGVSPKGLNLPCGVTLVSYGRPGIYIKASGYKDCRTWQKPVKLNVGGDTVSKSWSNSCCYTSMLALKDDEALIAYSNFKYNGEEKKTILVQKIKIKVE